MDNSVVKFIHEMHDNWFTWSNLGTERCYRLRLRIILGTLRCTMFVLVESLKYTANKNVSEHLPKIKEPMNQFIYGFRQITENCDRKPIINIQKLY